MLYELKLYRGQDDEECVYKFSSEESEALNLAIAKISDICKSKGRNVYYYNIHSVPDCHGKLSVTVIDFGSHTQFFHLYPGVPIG